MYIINKDNEEFKNIVRVLISCAGISVAVITGFLIADYGSGNDIINGIFGGIMGATISVPLAVMASAKAK